MEPSQRSSFRRTRRAAVGVALLLLGAPFSCSSTASTGSVGAEDGGAAGENDPWDGGAPSEGGRLGVSAPEGGVGGAESSGDGGVFGAGTSATEAGVGGSTRSGNEGGSAQSGTEGGSDWSGGAAGAIAGAAGLDGGMSGCDVSAGCACLERAERPCSQAGYVGKCATGIQTCDGRGVWSECSIRPSAHDSCVLGNNDDCAGEPNEGCLCIENVTTRDCGPCPGGRQTCVDGQLGQYGACDGPTQRTFYRDADEDGYGDVGVPFTTCGAAPPGFVTNADDCDDDNDDAFPGQTKYFTAKRANGTYDYDCNGRTDYRIPLGTELGPASCTGSCDGGSCVPNGMRRLDESTPCGATLSLSFCVCMGICTTFGSSGSIQECH